MRTLITYGLFPTTFAVAMAAAAVGHARGISEGPLLLGILTPVALMILAMERIHPAYPRWNLARSDVSVDVVHLVVSNLVVPSLVSVALTAAGAVIAVRLAEAVGGPLWPTQWPLLAQLVPALLISQFFEYWWHRLAHTWPPLWRLHATHHSAGRLYWLNAARFHPLDTAASYAIATAPLVLLGSGPGVVVLFTTWVGVHGLFQHCNIRLRLGPLNWIFSMAELHRWHHSKVLEEANANYGNNILFWDIVFGTVYWPSDREASEDVGLADMEDFPQDYLGQLLSPFRWRW